GFGGWGGGSTHPQRVRPARIPASQRRPSAFTRHDHGARLWDPLRSRDQCGGRLHQRAAQQTRSRTPVDPDDSRRGLRAAHPGRGVRVRRGGSSTLRRQIVLWYSVVLLIALGAFTALTYLLLQETLQRTGTASLRE